MTDSLSQSASENIAVTVLDVNDPPTLAPGAATVFNVSENYLHPPYPAPSRNLSVSGVAVVTFCMCAVSQA